MHSFIISLLLSQLSFAAVPESQFDNIVDFFKDHVEGVTLELKAQGDSYDEKFITEYKRMLTFGKLKVLDRGLGINLMAKVERTNFKKKEDGTAGEVASTDNSEITARLEIAERVSTGKVVGFMRTISVDGEKVLGQADAVVGNFNPKTNELHLMHSNIGYIDDTLDGVNFHPISRSSEDVFRLDDKGNLVLDQELLTYLVEPSTLERELKSTHSVSSTRVLGLPRVSSK